MLGGRELARARRLGEVADWKWATPEGKPVAQRIEGGWRDRCGTGRERIGWDRCRTGPRGRAAGGCRPPQVGYRM
jgi:hypothetical protein